MESHGHQFLPYDGSYPPYEPQRKPRGCVFYGCVAAIVVSVLLSVLVALALVFTYRMFRDFVREYAEDAPRPIPVAELPVDQLDSLKDRLARFQAALKADEPAEPLVLTSNEINALIDADPNLKGVVAADFQGDKLRGQVSFPLASVGFPGKFLNGTATFDVRIDNGLLLITFDTLEVRGKPIPESVMAKLRMENLAKDSAKDVRNAQQVGRVARIEVKDGKLVITPRKVAGATPAETPPKEEGAETKPAEVPRPPDQPGEPAPPR